MYTEKKVNTIRTLVERYGISRTAAGMHISEETVKRILRANPSGVKTVKDSVKTEAPILIIPDTHAPYVHPRAIEFLQKVHESRGCRQEVIHVGDILDFHSMSRHTKEPDALSPEAEYEQAMLWVEELTKAFPIGHLILGNHDNIPQRQMKELSLAPSLLKSENALYGLPEAWQVHPLYYVIPEWDVLVEHGIGSTGKFGAINSAMAKRCSYVQGHAHASAGVMYSSNYNSTLFGMNVGWLGDEHSLAIRYAKYFTKKGVLGCGVVYSNSYAEFIPMGAVLKGEV